MLLDMMKTLKANNLGEVWLSESKYWLRSPWKHKLMDKLIALLCGDKDNTPLIEDSLIIVSKADVLHTLGLLGLFVLCKQPL